jgi:transcriptional regulator with XRE-family HTH domain
VAHNVKRNVHPAYGRLLFAVSTIDPKEIGERIAAARNRKGMTQLDLAYKASVSPSSIQRWEAGRLPPVRELIRLAGLLEIDPEELVETADRVIDLEALDA